MPISYSILVNSSDSYSDCWEPFFTLFAQYWPHCPHKIYLNTEHKSFAYPGLAIEATQVSQRTGRNSLPWSECLLQAFDTIETDIVLYLQEDFFLRDYVPHERIQYFVNLMQEHEITYLGLVDSGSQGPFDASFHPELWAIKEQDPYQISLQACLLNKHKFRRYVRQYEDPWQFDQQAYQPPDAFYTVNRRLYAGATSLVPYAPTGIIEGQWNQEVVVELFAQHHLVVDYSHRGFYSPNRPRPTRQPLTFKNSLSRLLSFWGKARGIAALLGKRRHPL